VAIFALEIKTLFAHEGGYVDDPADSGGATNMGITHKTLARSRKVKSVTKDEVKALTKDEAHDIYFRDYWSPLMLDSVTSQTLAGAILDFGVNAGVRRAALTLQEAVNSIRGSMVLREDGRMGPMTMGEVNLIEGDALLDRFTLMRISFYTALCKAKPSQRKFLYAWVKRTMGYLG